MYRDVEPRGDGLMTRRTFLKLLLGGVTIAGGLRFAGVKAPWDANPQPPATPIPNSPKDIVPADLKEQENVAVAKEMLVLFKNLLPRYVNPALYDLEYDFSFNAFFDEFKLAEERRRRAGSEFQPFVEKYVRVLKRPKGQSNNDKLDISRYDAITTEITYTLPAPTSSTPLSITQFGFTIDRLTDKRIEILKGLNKDWLLEIPKDKLIPVARAVLRIPDPLLWNKTEAIDLSVRNTVTKASTNFEDADYKVGVEVSSKGTITVNGKSKDLPVSLPNTP